MVIAEKIKHNIMKNSNKGFSQNIIIIAVLAVLVIGGGFYLFNSGNLGGKQESYFSDKVTDMFGKGKPLECSAEIDNLEGQIKAVYYFDNQNKMVRVEMETLDKNSGLTVNTVSVIKDSWNYFWDDLINKDGMKIKFDEKEDSILSKESLNLENPDMDFDFVCKDWKVDSTKFDLPKDKSFKDLSGMMDNLPSGSSDNSSPEVSLDNLCEICDLLPDGPERIECLDAWDQN
jgi:RecJ-like exonuclease